MNSQKSVPGLSPGFLLRVEGLAVLSGACVGFHAFGGRWIWFGLLFFAPDLSMAGYALGPRIGSALYNLAHTYAIAIATLVLGFGLDERRLILAGWIWLAHQGFDRLLGFGLKYAGGFKDTHLSRV